MITTRTDARFAPLLRALCLCLLVFGLAAAGCARSGDAAAARGRTDAEQTRTMPVGNPATAGEAKALPAIDTDADGGDQGSAAFGANVAPDAGGRTSAEPNTVVRAHTAPGASDASEAGGVSGGPGQGADAPWSAAAPAAASADTNAFPRPEDVPLAKMGIDVGPSALKNSPGYNPPHDPEADAVRTGRRQVKPVDHPSFTGGMRSPEELALCILDAVRKRDRQALQATRVTQAEFAEILWPEFPQSRPFCNSNASDAFFFLDNTSNSGIGLALQQLGGAVLELEGIAYTGGRAPYTNFTLYHDVQLKVRTADGQPRTLRFARTFAERQGRWKVYTYKDWE